MGDTSATNASASTAPTNPGSNGLAEALTAMGGLTKANAIYTAGKTNAGLARANARIAAVQGDEAASAGNFAANQAAIKSRVLQGTQRAGQAGQGVVAGAGTSGVVIDQAEGASEMDQLMIRRQAARQALGFEIKRSGDLIEANTDEAKGKNEAISTLLNTGDKEWMLSDPSHTRTINFG